MYTITSRFQIMSSSNSLDDDDDEISEKEEIITVVRRYSQFVWLDKHLQTLFPPGTIVLPPLPPKTYSRLSIPSSLAPPILSTSYLDPSQVEMRCQGLQRWIESIITHPVLRNVEGVVMMLVAGGLESCFDIPASHIDLDLEMERWQEEVLDVESRMFGYPTTHFSTMSSSTTTTLASSLYSSTSATPSLYNSMWSGVSGMGSHVFYERVMHPEYNVAEDG